MNTLSPLRALLLAAALGAALPSQAQNLLANGGFETGDFTGWTLNANPVTTFVGKGFASEGIYAAYLGEENASGTLVQNIITVPNAKYTFSFDFAGDGDTPSFFTAAFGSTTVFSVTNPAFDIDYVTRTYTVTATSISTPITFTFRDDASSVNLDRVSVNIVQSAPEPTTMVAFGLGLVALRRRKRA